jgi:hypothetical protein
MKFTVTVLLLIFYVTGFAQSDAFRMKQFNLNDGVAIKGYDPVAYFTQNKAIKGKKDFSYMDHGVIYHFVSAADQNTFQSNPSKYEPQYGGWCAYAMGHEGSKVEVDPETFKIINGKLFLFYNHFFNNTLKTWNLDESNQYSHAETNSKKIIQ